MRGTRWYQPVIPVTHRNFSLVISLVKRAHTTTNPQKLKTPLDAGRDGLVCKLEASTDTTRVKIGGALVTFKRQSSMQTPQTFEDIYFNKPTIWANVFSHTPAHMRALDNAETSSLPSGVWLPITSSVGMRSVTETP